MKKNIIIAAIAAASALLLCASCQKQELVEQNNGNASGKTFTATIEQSLTKTTITSEYKVNWETGDQIDINGSIFSATPDASDSTKATFTKVSGSDPTPDYTAVYPASIMVETQATLPATQTYAAGKFNAPMCAMSSTETLEFKNFCGVLCFALKGTDKVKSIAVTANEQLCGPFEFSTDATFGCFSGENEGYTVTLDCGEGVQLDASTATNFYVYLPPKDSYTAGMKIVVTSTEGKTFEKTTTTAVKIERNNLYTFDWTASFSPAEPEYVEIGGVKWATKNLGATTVAGSASTCYGDYFVWGATELAYSSLSSNTFTFVASRPASYGGSGWTQSSGFKKVNAPYYNGSAYVKYTGASGDGKTVLESGDDAATALLGSGWRMPTSAEFKALYDACGGTETPKTGGSTSTTEKGVYWCDNYDGVAGLLFCDGTNKLFFPAAGRGNGTGLNYAGSYGYYWSSSLYTDNTDVAYLLDFVESVYPQDSNFRYYGYSVRPVSTEGVAPVPAPANPLYVEIAADYDNNPDTPKTTLKWYRQNLAISDSGKKAWKGDNTSGAVKVPGTNDDVIVGDYFQWAASYAGYNITSDSQKIPANLLLYTSFDNKKCGDANDKFYTNGGNFAKSFTKSNAPYSGTSYTKYTSGSENLEKTDDVANIILGDKWRMPTSAEFKAMREATYWAWDGTDCGYYVFMPGLGTSGAAGGRANINTPDDKTKALLFFPAAGCGYNTGFTTVGSNGRYWSSTLYATNVAYYLSSYSSDVDPQPNISRLYGLSVRPVSD